MIAWLGIIAAGILNGSFAVPMKTARVWKFEHIWGVFSLLAMALIPWAAVMLVVPGWRGILAGIPGPGLAGLVALGLIWGAASLLYGLAIDLLGIALGFSIQLGLSIVAGSLIPFAIAQGLTVRRPTDVVFLAGVAVMVGGVIVCARAGRGTGDAASDARRDETRSRARFRKGLVIAILGGLGSPLLNFGIQYGISLLPHTGERAGSGQWVAWSVFLSAAAVTQVGYCFYRIASLRQMALFRAAESGRDLIMVVAMSIVWAASIFLYGAGAASLGKLGTSVGWPIFIGLIVIASSAWGVLLGEWKGRPRSRLSQMIAGCAVLVAAAFIISQARAG